MTTKVKDRGIHAILALETQLSDRIYTSVKTNDWTETNGAATNLFGRNCDIVYQSNSDDLIEQAHGYAAGGQRVSAICTGTKPFLASNREAGFPPVPLVVYWLSEETHHSFEPSQSCIHFSITAHGDLVAFALAARKISECTLVPVVLEVSKTTIADIPNEFELPASSFMSTYFQASNAETNTPTKAQTMVFGSRRTWVPNYLDRNKPVATGLPLNQGLNYIHAASKKFFLEDAIEPIIKGVLESLTEKLPNLIKEHSLAAFTSTGLKKAEIVLVTEGGSFQSAKFLADYLKKTEKRHIAILNAHWIDADRNKGLSIEIKQAHANGKKVIFLGQRLESWFRRVQGQNQATPAPSLFFFQRPSLETIYSGIQHALAEGFQPGVYWLDCQLPASSDFPKREVLLNELRASFPSMNTDLLPGRPAPKFKPEGARTLAFSGFLLKSNHIDMLSEALTGRTKSGVLAPSPWGHTDLKLTAADIDLLTPGYHFPVDLYVSALNAASSQFFDELDEGAEVFFASSRHIEDFVKDLDPRWKEIVKSKQVKVFLFKDESHKLLDHVPQLLKGEVGYDQMEEITEKVVTLPSGMQSGMFPSILAEAKEEREIHNLPRFFGETIQPHLDQKRCFETPEPALAFNTIPSLTGLFSKHNQGPDSLPEIFFNCEESIGTPWLNCPDSALASVALDGEALLKFATSQGETYLNSGKDVLSKWTRSLKHLAGHWQAELAKASATNIELDVLEASFLWLMKKIGTSEHDVPAYRDILDCMWDSLKAWPVHVDPVIFHDQESKQKGAGLFLLSFVHPNRCSACGLCDKSTPGASFEMKPHTAERASLYRKLWTLYESMPDTTGKSISLLSETIGELPAVSLSRFTQFAMVGSGISTPGSGRRLALKMMMAMAEKIFQSHALKMVANLEAHIQTCHEKLQKSVSEALPIHDMSALSTSLSKAKGARIPVAELMDHLSEAGQKGAVDADNLKGFVTFIEEMQAQKTEIMEGNNGLGRARYGILMTNKEMRDQICFPVNPFQAPFAYAPPEQALAMADAYFQPYLEQISRLNQIEQGIQNGPKTVRSATSLKWHDLTPEQKKACPPLLVYCSSEDIQETPILQQMMSRPYPIKLVLLDSYSDIRPSFAPALNALLLDDVFVGSAVLNDRDHSGHVFKQALEYGGPAFLHLYTPEPDVEGVASDTLFDRSESAIQHGVHFQFYTDIEDPGIFGTRLHLERTEQQIDPQHHPALWAFEHAGLKSHFTVLESTGDSVEISKWLEAPEPGKRCHLIDQAGNAFALSPTMQDFTQKAFLRHRKLLEMTGYLSPFTDRIREQLKEELTKAFEKQATELEMEQKAALEQVRREEQALISEKVTNQLLRLTGYLRTPK